MNANVTKSRIILPYSIYTHNDHRTTTTPARETIFEQIEFRETNAVWSVSVVY